MKERWNELSTREQWLIKGGAGVLAFFLLWQFIISPITSWRDDQRSGYENSERLYQMVSDAAARSSAGRSASASTDTPPRTLITRTAANAGISLVFVNTRGGGLIDVNATGADPQSLFDWIALLERRNGLRIVNADIAREDGAGGATVRAQLTFQGAGANG